jgi:hypothetical protein
MPKYWFAKQVARTFVIELVASAGRTTGRTLGFVGAIAIVAVANKKLLIEAADRLKDVKDNAVSTDETP